MPIVTTDAQGNVVDPGSDFLRPGFPGQSQVLSDLYYNRNRDYDPVTGRYIQADPIGLDGDVNPYVYAGADPVNMIDPMGLRSSAADLFGSGHMILIRQAGDALGTANAGYRGPLYCFGAWEIGGALVTSYGAGKIAGGLLRLGAPFLKCIWKDRSGSVPGPRIPNATEKSVGPGPNARESIPAGPTRRPSAEQQRQINELGKKYGCHNCGTKDPGTKTGNFVGDHQPSTKLKPPGSKQVYYPHCLNCSNVQGGRVRHLPSSQQKK